MCIAVSKKRQREADIANSLLLVVIHALAAMSNLIISGCNVLQTDCIMQTRSVISPVRYVMHVTKRFVFFVVCM